MYDAAESKCVVEVKDQKKDYVTDKKIMQIAPQGPWPDFLVSFYYFDRHFHRCCSLVLDILL